jgi:hypothetical protein
MVQLKDKVEGTVFLLCSCFACFRPMHHFLTLASSSFSRLPMGTTFHFWVVLRDKGGAGCVSLKEGIAYWLIDMVVVPSKGEMMPFWTGSVA